MSALSSIISLGAGLAIGAVATAAILSKDDECCDCECVDFDEEAELQPIEDDDTDDAVAE